MQLDLRLPMGLLFTIVGLILTVFGFATNGDPIYARSMGLNANLDWGIVLLIFGLVMFFLGRRGQQITNARPPVPSHSDDRPARRPH